MKLFKRAAAFLKRKTRREGLVKMEGIHVLDETEELSDSNLSMDEPKHEEDNQKPLLSDPTEESTESIIDEKPEHVWQISEDQKPYNPDEYFAWLRQMVVLLAVIPFAAAYLELSRLATIATALLFFLLSRTHSVYQGWIGRYDIDPDMVREFQDPAVKPFLSRRFKVRPHHLFPDRKVWEPLFTVEHFKRRGLATTGITFPQAIFEELTWGMESVVHSVYRIVAVYFGIGRFSRKNSMSGVYKAIINTSMACYLDPISGHFVVHDSLLPQKQSSIKSWHKIVFELDHEEQVCVRATLQETSREAQVITTSDPNEVTMIALALGSLKCHAHVHLHANGVADAQGVWPLATESMNMIQCFNHGAVHTSPMVLGTTPDVTATIAHHNVTKEGLPMHRHLSTLLGKKSHAGMMSTKARKALHKAYPTMGFAIIESLLAATILHSCDHYYLDFHLGYKDYHSDIMEEDFTIFRPTMVVPNTYRTRRLLCCQHLDEPICRILYESCHEFDPVFADTMLFIGITA